MSDRNIVTQVGIEDLKFALSEVAENLSAHVNASLSKAHGLNILNGYIDDNGNNLNTYQDATGTVVGTHFVLFQVGNANYYAPANLTTLAGQSETSGSIQTSADALAQGGSAWVTDYTSDQVAQARSMNTDVLIPHTRLPHRLAHGGMSVTAQATYNALGNQIGTHIIRFMFDNVVYNIPVSNRFGGPAQPPRISGIPPNLSDHSDAGSEGQNKVNRPLTVTLLAGTLPVAYHWQYNNSGVWTDITPAASGNVPLPGWLSNGGNGVDFTWVNTSTPTFLIFEAKPGSGETRSGQFRCRVTNLAVPDTGPESGVITNVCTYTFQDDSGGCYISATVCAATGRGDDCSDLITLRLFRDTYMQATEERRSLVSEYYRIAPRIAAKLSKLPEFSFECNRLYRRFIEPAVAAINANNQDEAFSLYCSMVKDLEQRFK